MEKHFYQLKAEGETNCGWRRLVYSSTIFSTKELAEARIEKFKALVSDPDKNLDAIENPEVKIVELVLVK